MKFLHDTNYDQTLSLEVYKGKVDLYFEMGEVVEITMDGYVFGTDDICQAIFVNHNDKYYSLQDVINEAEKQFSDIIEETAREMAVENDMARELSSPYLTGRI